MLLEALRASRGRGSKGEGDGGGPGRVALVGTGPRDPELLTLKAVRAIKATDLVLYDCLMSNDVLDLVGESARLLYVGKTAGYHSRTQEEIHELLLSFAEAGANVVRLRGGDPLFFGRGGEEMDFLQQQGIRIEVIPGITSASGIAAELGIPLIHRGVSTRCPCPLRGGNSSWRIDILLISHPVLIVSTACDGIAFACLGQSLLYFAFSVSVSIGNHRSASRTSLSLLKYCSVSGFDNYALRNSGHGGAALQLEGERQLREEAGHRRPHWN
ncbi:hypothetical protein ABZP36_014612 [Zizania latifolia]